MTDNDKQILLIDLCGRLPHGVMAIIPLVENDNRIYKVNVNWLKDFIENNVVIKPYLRSMDTMTDKEYAEFLDTQHWECGDGNQPKYEYTYKTFDWLNTYHFDYRGLIKLGLALEAPEGMYND